MADVLAFWAAALLAAAVGLPVAMATFRRLPDAGAGLSFALGLLLTALPYFLLRTASVLPPGRGGFVAALALAALIAAATLGRDSWSAVTLRRAAPGIVVAAAIFTCAFFGYTAFRSYNAEIGGTEQPMDLMYLNAALNSADYPVEDPWLAGENASYYYFGYVQTAALTAIAGVPASTGYNLGLAYTFAATASGVVSVGWALARWAMGPRRKYAFAGGGIAVALVLFSGSLSAVFEWPAAHGNTNEALYDAFGVGWMVPCAPGETADCYTGPVEGRTDRWYPSEYWFWWRGSRVIPGTITEFPFFSFLLGDLHPHVMALPLVLLAAGTALATWRGRGVLGWQAVRRRPAATLLLAGVFGALAFQNAWDVITFSTLLLAAVFARNARRRPPLQAAKDTLAYLAPAAAAAAVIFAPWWLEFSSQASGIYAYTGAGTRPAHAFLQFGVLGSAALLTLGFVHRATRPEFINAALGTAWLVVVPFVGWVALAAARGDLDTAVDERGAGGWVTLVVYGSSVWALAAATVVLALARKSAAPAVGLAALGALLLYGAELFFIRDVFFGSVPRLNTVFKLTYQVWLLFGLAGGAGVLAALDGLRRRDPWSGVVAVPAVLLISAGAVYPLLAAFNRTESFSRETAIDGLEMVARIDPAEYALTQWIAEHTDPGDVVIEATGRRWALDSGGAPSMVSADVDYSDAGRIAARTGRTTPIGWYFHEIQWRGDTGTNRAEFTRRQDLVDAAYTAADPSAVLASMQALGARYLVVGHVEIDRYPGLMPDFGGFLDTAFESGQYRVYALPEYRMVATR